MLSFFIAPTKVLCDPHRALLFCDTELQRLSAITSAKRREEYIAGHCLLRLAASQTLGLDAQHETWVQPENSSPQLAHHSHLAFGLSHSAGWVAALIESADEPCADGFKVGIDIELERNRKKLTQLAMYSFTADWLDQHQLRLLPAFFQRWTLCEALVKGSHKTLGTELLRHQHFLSDATSTSGHWLYHARIQPDIQADLCFEPEGALHISLCSETHYQAKDIRGFIFLNGDFIAMENLEFSVFKAPSN